MKNNADNKSSLRGFLILLGTQSFSALGSAMTSFALIVWSYSQERSALTTALLSVCSYAPYVVMSIFAGAVSDRWKKKPVLLACDAFAAMTTAITLALLESGRLRMGHLYAINALSGLMNSIQQPAADVSVSLLVPRERDQQASALRSIANSLVNILTPALASAALAFGGLRTVILIDLGTFAAAFLSLLFLVRIPDAPGRDGREGVFSAARAGMRYLKRHPGVLHLILFLAAINLTASMYEAALPALMLSRTDETALGALRSATGAALLLGSVLAAVMPRPKSRVRVICNTLLISMSTENFFLALGRGLPVWCVGSVLGWIVIPMMNANMDALLRGYIPVEVQGRVFAVRNTCQFCTIPLGYLLGGALVDGVFEPMMAAQPEGSLPALLFGSGAGAGAAALFFLLGLAGVVTCLVFRRDGAIRVLEEKR